MFFLELLSSTACFVQIQEKSTIKVVRGVVGILNNKIELEGRRNFIELNTDTYTGINSSP